MTDLKTTQEISRTPDGSEYIRLATTGANWKATLANIFSALGVSAGGSNTQVQYNNTGTLAGASNFNISSGNPNVTTGNAYLYNNLNLAFQVDPGGGNQLNTFIGGSGNLTVTGFGNFGEGPMCLSNVSTGIRNMGMGEQALETVSAGSYNAAMGALALNHCNSDRNMAVGASALFNLTSGTRNMAIGSEALLAETVGNDNVAIGDGAGNGQNGATNNVLIGRDAGSGLTTGSFNTFVGDQTGHGITTGTGNTVIGTGFTSTNSGINGAIIFQTIFGTEFDVNYTNSGKLTIGNTRTLIIPAMSTAGIVVNDASGNILTNSTVNAATVTANFTADHRLTLTIAGSTYYLPVSTTAW